MDIFLSDYKLEALLFVRVLLVFKIFEQLTVVIINLKLFTGFYEIAY
jgi:hypothetical protein